MKIIFFGNPSFSSHILESINNKVNVIATVSSRDSVQGRGRKIKPQPVKMKSNALNIINFQPHNLEDIKFIKKLENLNADLFIVVAFRKLPEIIWKLPKYGCINLHTSLLPNYKGAAPINWVLINGEVKTGLSTFFINNKIDSGNIILQEEINLDNEITAASLHNIMLRKGAKLVLDTMMCINKRSLGIKQINNKSYSLAPKLNKGILKIDWNKSANEIHNLIRGLSPVLENNNIIKDVSICPSSWFYLVIENEKKIRIKLLLSRFSISKHSMPIGSLLTDNKSKLKVAVIDGFISILKLQAEGKKPMSIKNFLSGNNIKDSFTAI
jgi:methionyl-tRNA formyltransferase